MGEEIEKFILKKLDDVIEESKDSTHFNIAARFWLPKLHKDLSELKDLIEKKRNKIKLATAPPAVRDPSAPPASTSAASANKDSKRLLPATEKKSQARSNVGDKKDTDTGAPLDAIGDKKDTDTSAPWDVTDVGDKKDTGALKELVAPPDTGDKKDTDTGSQKDTDTSAPTDVGDKKDTGAAPLDAIGDKKELDAPPDSGDKKDTADAPLDAGDEKESGAPSDAGSEKESTASSTGASEKESASDAGAEIESSSTGASEKESASDAGAEIESGAPLDAIAGDKKESTAHLDESEISPVTDGGATDHKSKTPTSVGGGKEESGISHADKSTTAAADTSNKSDSNSDATKREEALLREQLYYLNNVLTEWQMITKKPFSCSDSVSSIKDLSKTLKKIKQDLKPEPIKKTEESSDSRIPQTGSSDNASQIETTPEVMEFRWSTRVNLEKVHGFEDRILSLERLLVLRRKDTDAFKAFGIHGMAGVGKTTLCQSIFSRPKVKEYFFPRIWVCLSKQKDEDEDNKKEVVKRMLRCLGIDDNIIEKVDEKQSIRGLLFALRLQLTGKRYFIVLDDAHNADKWFKMLDSDAENDDNKIYQKFSYGLPKECGGTVLVTSRVEQVVKNMVGEEENLRRIEPLTDENTCWNIFKDTVEKDNIQFPVDLVKLKLEIVKRCDGLPLAAKLLGQIKHEELRKNSTAASNQQAAVQAGNRQAAVEASKQQAAVQAAK